MLPVTACDARDEIQRTPLHASAVMGQKDALLALLQAGSAVDAKDNEGRTALDIAKRYQEAEVGHAARRRRSRVKRAEQGDGLGSSS